MQRIEVGQTHVLHRPARFGAPPHRRWRNDGLEWTASAVHIHECDRGDHVYAILDPCGSPRQIRAAQETEHNPSSALLANAMTVTGKSVSADWDEFDTKSVEMPRVLGKIQALAARGRAS